VLILRPIVAICASSPCDLCMIAEAVLTPPDPPELPDVPHAEVASAEACEANARISALTTPRCIAVWKYRMRFVLFLLSKLKDQLLELVLNVIDEPLAFTPNEFRLPLLPIFKFLKEPLADTAPLFSDV